MFNLTAAVLAMATQCPHTTASLTDSSSLFARYSLMKIMCLYLEDLHTYYTLLCNGQSTMALRIFGWLKIK